MTVSDGDAPDRPDPRDRDELGRARNARPRDALGRPLPYGSPGVQRQMEGQVRTPDETVAEAQRLLDAGLPFHAHEVFEDAWKSASDPVDRALWKALAQLAVACTHSARGNAAGARILFQRAIAALEPFRGQDRHGLDLPGVLAWAGTQLATPGAGGPLALRGRSVGPG